MGMNAVRLTEERPSFTEIISLHQSAVYRYLARFTRHQHDAEDLFQETFLRAHRAYAALPAEANVRAWLMRIAINLTKNYVRDRQRRHRVIVEAVPEPVLNGRQEAVAGVDTESAMIFQETAQTLWTAIEELPFRQRVAFVQRQFEGLEYETIADNLGCSQDGARAHVYQALRKLRLALDQSASNERKR
jgi:RNA polymerase sigma-70 factor (ECF subfamily)